MKHVLRSKSLQRSKPRTPSASSFSPKSLRTSPEERTKGDAAPLRLKALYCTPHMKVPGILFACPLLITFKPDPSDQHVKEFGDELYTVTLEVQDILQCGGITMPLSDGKDLSYFLQLQIRTLNGKHFRLQEDVVDPWFVVFSLVDKRDLNQVTSLLLEAKKAKASSSACPSSTQTSVPFPCLDCMAELEHALHHHQLQQQLAKERSPSTTARLFANWTKFLSGPGEAAKTSQEVDVHSDPGSPIHVEKVALRLPENLESALLTNDLAEALMDFLPVSLRLPGLVEWVLRYTPKAHGVSLSTMFRNMAERDKTIVIIQDTEDFVFGGFATSAWEPAGRFYGSGEAVRGLPSASLLHTGNPDLLQNGTKSRSLRLLGCRLSCSLSGARLNSQQRFNSSPGLRKTRAACMQTSPCLEWEVEKDGLPS
ncbi:OXR1 [Symbiodinium sp. CCMP2456]|nr:OXR1 [Symbiodinium sp. CCMP2456]